MQPILKLSDHDMSEERGFLCAYDAADVALPSELAAPEQAARQGATALEDDVRQLAPQHQVVGDLGGRATTSRRHSAADRLEAERAEVLRGMNRNSARSVDLIVRHLPTWMHGLGRDFAGIKGSRIYAALERGDVSYRSYHFAKPL